MRPPSFPGRGGEARGGMAEPAPGECAKGVSEIEGYLLWQAETAAARDHAERFADRLPWLTCGQREEVVRAYTADRLETSRQVIRRIAGRARELQAEYQARYEVLRMRLLGMFVAALAGCTGVLLVLSKVG